LVRPPAVAPDAAAGGGGGGAGRAAVAVAPGAPRVAAAVQTRYWRRRCGTRGGRRRLLPARLAAEKGARVLPVAVRRRSKPVRPEATAYLASRVAGSRKFRAGGGPACGLCTAGFAGWPIAFATAEFGVGTAGLP